MLRRPARRVLTIVFVMVSLLFAQLALAQYVCPLSDEGEAHADVMEMAPGMPCTGMDTQSDTPALCHHHCTNAAQSFEPVKLPVVSLPAIVQVFVLPLRTVAAQPKWRALALEGEAQPPPSPVFLSTLRLRV